MIQLTERDDRREQESALRKERTDVAKRIARYLADFESGDAPPSSMTARLRDLETRQRAIEDELANMRPVPRLPAAVAEDRLAEWRRLRRASITQGRAVLQCIVVGRIRFTHRAASEYEEAGGYDFEAQTQFDKLFAGVAAPQLSDGTDLTGTDNIGRADTWDANYSRLLERAQKRSENRLCEMGSVPTGKIQPV